VLSLHFSGKSVNMNEAPTTLYELNHEIMRMFSLKEDEYLLKSKTNDEVVS
jgi:hypothetical protein